MSNLFAEITNLFDQDCLDFNSESEAILNWINRHKSAIEKIDIDINNDYQTAIAELEEKLKQVEEEKARIKYLCENNSNYSLDEMVRKVEFRDKMIERGGKIIDNLEHQLVELPKQIVEKIKEWFEVNNDFFDKPQFDYFDKFLDILLKEEMQKM